MRPLSLVYLLATPFRADNYHVIYSTASRAEFAQTLLTNYPYKIFNTVTWERDGQTFRAAGRVDEIRHYNYVIYKNPGDTYRFAFITDVRYINENVSFVETKVDVWNTYQTMITFQPSIMVRQHPDTDVFGDHNLPEPLTVAHWNVTKIDLSKGSAPINNDSVYVVTANSAHSFTDRSTDFYTALSNFASGDGSALDSFFSSVATVPCDCSGITQANTSRVDREGAQKIVSSYAKVGRSSNILSMYHIPGEFDPKEDVFTWDFENIPAKNGTFDCVFAYGSEKPKWNKIRYSSQYNQCILNVCGNTRSYDWELFAENQVDGYTLSFDWTSSGAESGCIFVQPKDYAGEGKSGDYALTSPTWDKVQISIVQPNEQKLNYMQAHAKIGVAKTVTSGTLGAAGSLITGHVGGALSSLANAAVDVADIGLSYAENAGEEYLDSAVNVGVSVGTIQAYENTGNALVKASIYNPSQTDMKRLNNYFSTFGYNYNMQIAPIVLDSMPIWNFVHTADCNVRGDSVPQDAILEICALFNRGIFLYHGLENYRNTSKVSENVLN